MLAAVHHCFWRVGVLIGVLLREGCSCYSTPRPLLTYALSVLALLSSPPSFAQPFVPSQQESCVYYQPPKLCWPPLAMAFTALRLPTCTGVLIPAVEVPKVKVPLPSWPRSLAPQAHTVPSSFSAKL